MATGVKATKLRNLREKKEKPALQGKKGFPNKKKGEKGKLKILPFKKSAHQQKKKKLRAGPIFLNPKKSPLLSIQPGGKSY